jgi:hypothetical protein
VASAESARNTDLLQMNLKGSVQSFTETSYAVDSSGKMGKVDSIFTENDFDKKGYLTDVDQKDQAGKVHTKQNFTRFDNGAVKEFNTIKDGRQNSRLVTELDKDGKYIGGKTYDSTGRQDSYYKDLATNEYGIVYAGKQYTMANKLKGTFDMKYEKANFVGGTATDSTGKTSYQGSIKLNDKGDPIEETSTTLQKDSTRTEKMTYKYDTYDDAGNWTQRTTYNEKGKPGKVVKRTYSYYKD